MPDRTIRVRSIRDARWLARNFGGILSGRVGDQFGIRTLFQAHLVHYVLSRNRESFLAKSSGGVDEFGDRWRPLKPATIAQRPVARGERKKLGIQALGRGGRGLLTADQNRQWRGIFATTYARLVARRVGDARARAIAGKTAWAIMKSRGAKTKLETLGRRNVPIMRVSDDLLESIGPGEVVGDTYRPPSPHQVVQMNEREVTVDFTLPYAARQHRRRRIYPAMTKMKRWFRDGVKWAAEKVLDRIVERVR